MPALSKIELQKIWEDPTQTKIGFNLQYEAIWLSWQYGWEIRGPCRDPMVGAFLLDENSTDHSLQALCTKYLKAPAWKDQFKPYEETLSSLSYVPTSLWSHLIQYNELDLQWTRRLDDYICSRLRQEGLESLFHLEMENLKTLARMTTWGIAVDTDYLKDLEEQYTRTQVSLASGFTFNPASPQQVLSTLIAHGYKVKGTGEEVLSELSGDLPRRILEYRKIQKVLSTYLRGLRNHIYPDGRIHPRFHQNRVVSGRLSSSEPNAQNFPRDDDDLQYRKLFRGTWGRLVRLDFNQLELRIAAWLSRDERMLDVFRTNQDIHSTTGERIWHKQRDKITENERVVSKITNFTSLYDPFDSAPYSVWSQCKAAGVELSRGDAANIIESFRRAYPGWFSYVDRLVRQIQDEGQVRSPFGRIRRDYGSQEPTLDRKVRTEILRSIVNSLVQGSAGDLVKFVGTVIDRRLRARGFKSRICNNIHDEILIDTHPEEEKDVVQIAFGSATKPPLGNYCPYIDVPLVVDIGVGETWSESKKKENRVTPSLP